MGLGLGLGILEIFSNPNDAIVLFKVVVTAHGGDGLRLGLEIMEVISNLNDSKTLWPPTVMNLTSSVVNALGAHVSDRERSPHAVSKLPHFSSLLLPPAFNGFHFNDNFDLHFHKPTALQPIPHTIKAAQMC